MIVLEKESLWLEKPQQKTKYPSILTVEKGKTESRASIDWNHNKDKKTLRKENNYGDSLPLKKYRRRRPRQVARSRSYSVLKQAEIEETFTQLVNRWREETRGISSTNQLSMHPAYQQIIGMGEAVIPLLLRELQRKTGRWFWALQCITREDPVPPEYRGKTNEMIRVWLEWGRQRGYEW